MKTIRNAWVLIPMVFLFSCTPALTRWQLDSPGANLRIEISQQEASEGVLLTYSVFLKMNESYVQVMDPSPLGIVGKESRFVEDLVFISEDMQSDQSDSYTLVTGKKLHVSNSYNTSTLTFQNGDQKQIALMLRAYDKGFAFRYHFPGNEEQELLITEELTGFDFRDGNFWGHPYDTLTTYTPAYETYYEGTKVGTAAPAGKNGWAFPVLVESEGAWLLASEAGMDGNYGASHLQAECEDGRYMIRFAEQGEAEGYYENSSTALLPFSTPWRFIAIGESLSQILESTLPTDLSEPSRIEDTSWIRPGRAAWSWWSDNPSSRDYSRMVPFIDFAAEMGWEYFLVDANWNRMENGSMEELAAYAAARNVALLLWYNSGGVHNVVTEEPRDLMWDRELRRAEFERIRSLGIKGVKVDFFQSDKQEIIRQYLAILEDAADFRLMVNFHGCTMPRGWRRTWPNLVSMEAVRGEECYIFDPRFPELAPPNMTIIAFTRNVLGPVDYTPGGFSDNTYPHLTTYGFELALPVILESGIMHFADTPGRARALPSFALDFLKQVPVVWEETRFLAGYPGREVVLARRNGEKWYLAAINGEDKTKDITVDLSALGSIPTEINLIMDGKNARDLQATVITPADGRITLSLLPYGGCTGSWEK